MPSVLIHVTHLVGIGHLMRARLVARALADIGFDVHLVSGGMPIGGRPADGVHVVQLPPVRVIDGDFSILRDADGRPVDEDFRRRRRELLLATFDALAPAAVIVETFPFGRRALAFELVPLLERCADRPRRPVVVASVRDILQKRKPEREREIVDAARRWFDAVLVHGDPGFAKIDATFTPASELAIPVHYTGFVVANDVAPNPPESVARREVVVSAGGGAVGARLLAAALAARRRSRFAHLTWRLLAGPNVSTEDFERLRRDAGDGAIVERTREDFAALLASALVSVSQAGYNTVLDVVRSGARAVLVPYADHGETEQTVRAGRLRELGYADVVAANEVTPARLAAAIDAAGSQAQGPRWPFACDGAARSARLVAESIERAANAGRAPR